MTEYLISLKNKYGYDDQMINMINGIINAFIQVLGEDKRDIILNTFNKVRLIQYDDSKNATEILNQIINDGNDHVIKSIANTTGFTEDYYTYSGGQLEQNYIIGISKVNPLWLQTLIHEFCHAISTLGKMEIKENEVIIKSGLSASKRELVDGKVGEEMLSVGNIFNEIVTENLAMQIMDVLEPNIEHEPCSYNGAVQNFKSIFRSDALNGVIIQDYLQSTNEFLLTLKEVISKEELNSMIDTVYGIADSTGDLNNEQIKNYIEYIRTLSVKDFFKLYIKYCDYMYKRPDGIDRNSFKMMKQINSKIVFDLSKTIDADRDMN